MQISLSADKFLRWKMSFFLQNCQHSVLFLIINQRSNKKFEMKFSITNLMTCKWRLLQGSNISTFNLRWSSSSPVMWLLVDFLSNFNTLDDNIMKELSHSFVRLSFTPIIESFLSSDFRYSNNKKNYRHPGTSWCSNWTAQTACDIKTDRTDHHIKLGF